MHINIPNPCGQDWNQMTPSVGGRHCAQCAKTVINFTELSAAEISFYLQINAGTSICGRFTEDQLAEALPTPENYVLQVLRSPLPFMKQIAALIIFALFMGAAPFESQAIGKAKTKQHATKRAAREAPTRPEPAIVGMIAVKRPADTPAGYKEPVMGKVAMPPKGGKAPGPAVKAQQVLQGDVQYVPDKRTSKAQKPAPPQHITGLVAMPASSQKK